MSLSAEEKLVALHVHARSAEGHGFHAQAESLFRGTFSAQLDRAARADDAVPGQSGNLPQDAHDLARGSGPARRFRDRSVAGHGSRRQGAKATQNAGTLVFISILVFVLALIFVLNVDRPYIYLCPYPYPYPAAWFSRIWGERAWIEIADSRIHPRLCHERFAGCCLPDNVSGTTFTGKSC
jgi:hypothetical protein